jgi:hypothetical protein
MGAHVWNIKALEKRPNLQFALLAWGACSPRKLVKSVDREFGPSSLTDAGGRWRLEAGGRRRKRGRTKCLLLLLHHNDLFCMGEQTLYAAREKKNKKEIKVYVRNIASNCSNLEFHDYLYSTCMNKLANLFKKDDNSRIAFSKSINALSKEFQDIPLSPGLKAMSVVE